ncbi:universal stress protein [Nitratireductor mangrovi]|uniref:Universal stress protein n=1 Tax=Nitratireductor mangrovi TaxID=2599600 RepID=A0A5B8KXX3_9HYPH|nr:universal stress protein [Nitratireductor mangrovi]QDZ00330.1 universal stress protein [Nitratireductor mangrovi]
MFERILVPVDLGEVDIANRTLAVAEELADKHGARLDVLTVVPTYTMSIVGAAFPKDFAETTLEAVRARLKEMLDARPDGKVTVKGHVAHGTIYDEIMKAANALGSDLIVMASHRPELKDYLLGPNAARVVRHARQSVFVVRDLEKA